MCIWDKCFSPFHRLNCIIYCLHFMNRIIYNLAFLLLFSLVLVSLVACGRKSIDEQFYEAAKKETQQMCPRKIDDSTTLDSIVYDMLSRTQKHYYTFSDHMDDTTLYTNNFVADIRETLLKSLRNEIKLKKQMEAEIGFAYIYISASTGKPLINLLFTKDDYTGPMKVRSFNERITGKWDDYTLRNCPEQQDECTQLEKVTFDSINRVINYVFKLKGELDIQDLQEQYPDVKKEMKKMLIKGIRENDALSEENDSCVNYRVEYLSKSTGKHLLDISIKGKEIKVSDKQKVKK